MAKRPTRYARLATNAAPGMIVEPSAGYLESGFPVDRRPPAQWFNHLFNNIGGWLDFLRGPSLANWVSRTVGTGIVDSGAGTSSVTFIAADVEGADTSVCSRIAIAGLDVSSNLRVFASHRGIGWYEVSRFTDTTLGAVLWIQCQGSLWHLSTVQKLLYTVLDNGVSSALTVGGSAQWLDTGEVGVSDLAYDSTHGNRWLLGKNSAIGLWKKSIDGITWTAASVTGIPTGYVAKVVWDGSRFVSLLTTGQVWTTPDLDTPLTLAGTVAVGSTSPGLCTGEGKAFAYSGFLDGTNAYRTSDHGVTWIPVALPSDMKFITDVIYSEGQWLATTKQFPYLWTSNDLIIWERAFLPLPTDLTDSSLIGAARAQQSLLLLGSRGEHVWQSTIAHDAANGDPTTFLTPVARSDAAYFHGREVSPNAPSPGQVLSWDDGLDTWVPTSLAGVGGTDAASLRTRAISTAIPADGDVLVWDEAGSLWFPIDLPPAVATALTALITAVAAAAVNASVVHLAGAETVTGSKAFTDVTAPIIVAKLGPTSGQQHALPAVTSGTIALVSDLADKVSNTISRSYPMAGGTHDYTLDANWTPALYTETSDAVMSGVLGDGVDVPFFHVIGRDRVAANGMTRTAGGQLRITHDGSAAGNAYPGSYTAPGLLIRLPLAQILSVTFTVSMGNFATLERPRFGIASLSRSFGSSAAEVSTILWTPSSTTAASESTTLWSASAGSAAMSTFIAANICTRTYKLDLQGPNLGIYGSASSGSIVPSTLLRGRSTANTAIMSDLVLFLSLGSAAAPAANYYAEIGNLSLGGTRYLS